MFHKNYRRLFGLELPHMDVTNDLFESLYNKEIATHNNIGLKLGAKIINICVIIKCNQKNIKK
jgi:hypothetical protein